MDNFRQEAAVFLTERGFSHEEGSEIFILNRTVQMQGATMMINGQTVQQPGQIIQIYSEVEFFGEGYVSSDPDEIPFEIIKFTIVTGNQNAEQWMDSFYSEDIEQFKQAILKITQ